ncbi:MAG: M1 family metallopeptidase [Terriglobia bacterium]
MMRSLRWATLGVVAFSLCGFARGQEPSATSPPPSSAAPLSQRVVHYQIDARLDPVKKTIEATETLTYKNLTGQPQDTFPFHLYLNAFQPQSTFMREVRLYGTRGTTAGSKWDPKHYGAEVVKSFVAQGGDLTHQIEFIQPDDRNKDDRTVFQVKLPKPVAPGESVNFQIAFHDQLPEVLERTGYKRNFFMVGQWFPKVGVWWHGAWNCHQFHATTEFFSDFGVYDVRITVPKSYVAGAAGDLVATINNPDGTKTLTYHSDDTHDFSWTASPDFTDVEDSWTGSAGTVKIHLLVSPGHMRIAPRYIQSIKGTLDRFDKWYGPYPYDRITIVDPPDGGTDAGGMEYPTLITGDSAWWEPRGLKLTELVTVHEFGHQYWYGMVATNEFEEAWMDEGINSYSEVKVMDSLYGKGRSAVNFLGMTADDAELQRDTYLALPDTDPMTRFGWKFMSSNAYGTISYGKTATVLLTLEGMIGEPVMRQAMHTYFLRYRFTHPTHTDFLKTIEDVSGQNLEPFFDQAVYGTKMLDYAIEKIGSDRADWYLPRVPKVQKGKTLYNDQVLVRRKGTFILPVEVEIKFDNGEKVREHWDGKDRWARFTYLRKAKVVSAEIDPDHKIWLDSNFFNNSQTAAAHQGATRKLSNDWLFLTQFFEQLLAWLA